MTGLGKGVPPFKHGNFWYQFVRFLGCILSTSFRNFFSHSNWSLPLFFPWSIQVPSVKIAEKQISPGMGCSSVDAHQTCFGTPQNVDRTWIYIPGSAFSVAKNKCAWNIVLKKHVGAKISFFWAVFFCVLFWIKWGRFSGRTENSLNSFCEINRFQHLPGDDVAAPRAEIVLGSSISHW